MIASLFLRLTLARRSRLNSQGVNIGLLAVEQIVHAEKGMTSECPSFLVSLIWGEQFVESFSRFSEVFLEDTDLGFGHKVASRLLVLDVVQNLACHIKDSPLKKEVDEIEEHRVAIFACQLLISCLDFLVINDLNFEFNGLCAEILRDWAFRC